MAKKVLLAEDDPFIAEVYVTRLKKDGFMVDVAKDGKMAWEKIKNNYPDLLLLDIRLPEISGPELLKMIRQDQRTKNLKVIIISNLNKEDYAKDVSDLGVVKYFLKVESTPEEIMNAVREVLM